MIKVLIYPSQSIISHHCKTPDQQDIFKFGDDGREEVLILLALWHCTSSA